MNELTHQEIMLLFYALHNQAYEHKQIINKMVTEIRRAAPDHLRNDPNLANDDAVFEQVNQRDKLLELANKLLELSKPASAKEA